MKTKNVYIFAVYDQSTCSNQIVGLESKSALIAVKSTLIKMCGDHTTDAAFQRGINACHNTCESLTAFMANSQGVFISGVAEIAIPIEAEVIFNYQK